MDTMQSNNITQYIQNTDFQPHVYLKLCLLKYYQYRTSPNIKLLTLNDTIFVLNYLGCSFDGGDITTFVKLALRFKNLMKGIPQGIPIERDQKFDDWYAIFLNKLKSQIAEAFSKIKSENDENETFIKNYLLTDKTIMKKGIMLIERDIIKYSKDNKASDQNTSDSPKVVEDLNVKETSFSSEDDEPLTKIAEKKQSLINRPKSSINVDSTSIDNLKSAVVSTILSSLTKNDNSTKALDDQQIPNKTTTNELKLSDKESSSEDISRLMLTSLNSSCLANDTSEIFNQTTSLMDVNPVISNVISLACSENVDAVNVYDEDNSDKNSVGLINPDNSLKKKLYEDLIREALDAEITTTEVITLDDDDDDDNNMQINPNSIQTNVSNLQSIPNNMQANINNPQSTENKELVNANDVNSESGRNKKVPEETPLVSYLQAFVSEKINNSNVVNPTYETPERSNTEAVINNEIDESENSKNSNDSVINTPLTFLIDKQSINSIPFRTFIAKAKSMYRVIKSPFIDEYFQKHCSSRGSFSIPTQKQLLAVLCKNFLDINLDKRLEIYTDIVLGIFKFCVENSSELLEFTFDKINNDKKLFNDILIQFKSMLKYMLYFCLEKLQLKLKNLQKYTSDIIITPDDVQDLAISFNVPTEAHFKTLRLISQSNIIDIKHYPMSRQGFTIRQIYNFPGVTIKCQFTDIEFGRTNLSNYKSSVTLSSRKCPVVVNKRIINDKKLKPLEENHQDVALSAKYLMNYFQSVFAAFQQGEISGIKYLRDVCMEFLKDIDYISPSRKAMVMNSEYQCSLNNYAYVVAPNINVNRISLKHVINPEIKIYLKESENTDDCSLKLICNLCNVIYEAFDSDQTIKSFSKHLVRVHGYFPEAHTCVHCKNDFSFQELLNKRWMHEC